MTLLRQFPVCLGTLLLLCLPFLPSTAQIAFTESSTLLSETDVHSGVSIGVVDMNKDGYDDIVQLNQGTDLRIEYQQPDGTFSGSSFMSVASSSQWGLCIADVDANGHRDVAAGGVYDDVKLVTFDPVGSSATMTTLPGATIFMQNANFADINNDGWTDFFACHDDAESRIWGNDGAGTLVSQDGWIDMTTVPASDNSGNYGSVWTDIDRDGDIDLYIAKCRQGVSDPTDPRRINALFINDGAGNYTEQAAAFGLKIGAQSWTADFADFDNDGDMDAVITNHDVASMLLENDGSGNFNDITTGSGFDVTIFPIQSKCIDFDNDGYMDVLVSGSDHQVFRGNGDLTFSEVTGLFDGRNMESFGVGDLNHDGFPDIYAGYANIYTSPTTIDDALWLNNANSNHWLAVNLIGTVSNIDGLGAMMELHGPWGVQLREVRAGESYGICNSFTKHFGIGTETAIDSLVVLWPSGIRDVVVNPGIDQFMTIIENTCVSPDATVTASGPLTFCSGDDVMLTAPAGFNYVWSSGETTQSISVTDAGYYSVTIDDGTGCFASSAAIQVIVDPDETPSLTVLGDTVFCSGGSVELQASDAASWSWSHGPSTQSVTISDAGTYSVTIPGMCGDFTSQSIEVVVEEGSAPDVSDTIVSVPGTYTLIAGGDSLLWYDSETASSPVATGNSVDLNVPVSTSFWIENLSSFGGQSASGGKLNDSGLGGYSSFPSPERMFFDADQNFIIKGLTVYAQSDGSVTVHLYDNTGVLVDFETVTVVSGENRLSLNIEVPAGTDHYLTVADLSPNLYRSTGPQPYPFELGTLGAITGNSVNDDRYYYFYDWYVEQPALVCVSDREEMRVDLYAVGIESPELGTLNLFPVPADDQLRVTWSSQESLSVSLTDMSGRMLQQQLQLSGQADFDVSDLPAGTYLLVLENPTSGFRHTELVTVK